MRAGQRRGGSSGSDTERITAAQLAGAHAASRASVSADQAAHFDEIEAAFMTGGVAETAIQAAGRATASQRVCCPDADPEIKPSSECRPAAAYFARRKLWL